MLVNARTNCAVASTASVHPAMNGVPYRNRANQGDLPETPLGSDDQVSSVEAYWRILDLRIREIIHQTPRLTRTQLFSRMRGAFPAVVQSRVESMGLDVLVEQTSNDDSGPPVAYSPELHPLDFEWYFDSESARQLAHWFTTQRGEIVCLGTPTVANALRGIPNRASLIDSNPAIIRRFPRLAETISIYVPPVARAPLRRVSANVLILDAPWYPLDILQWIFVAAHITKLGGMIVFSLFPPLTRPTGETERQEILDFVSTLGKVEVVDDALVYETPLFERQALIQKGISDAGRWRRGDLVVIEVERPLAPSLSPPMSARRPRWETFFVSNQVIKIRHGCRTQVTPTALLSPVEGLTTFVYPTVSARDRRRDTIDIWTSRNRVARIGDMDSVVTVLGGLQRGLHLSAAIRDAAREHAPRFPKEAAELSFRRVLGEEV